MKKELDYKKRLDEILKLGQGWLYGKSYAKPFKKESLDFVKRIIEFAYAKGWPIPYIYPEPGNGINLEWEIGTWEISMEIQFDYRTFSFYAFRAKTYFELDGELDSKNLWRDIDSYVSNLVESIDKENKMKVLEIEDVQLLWHKAYYDGTLSGLLSYNNEIYFFDNIDEPRRYGCYRRYYLYPLEMEEFSRLYLDHLDFERYVSLSSSYKDNKREYITRDKSLWSKYYDNKERRKSLNVDSLKNKPLYIAQW